MNWSFNSILTALQNRLITSGSWNVILLGLGVFKRLLDVMAYGLEKIGYYADFVFTNSFLKTATYLPAVTNKAWQFNYKPHRKIGAFGTVKISGDSTFASTYMVYTGKDVNIPQWSTFTDNDKTLNIYSTASTIYTNGLVIVNRTMNASSVAVQYTATSVAFTITAHQMPAGQTVSIRGTANYDGDYIIQLVPDANTIVVVATYVAETFNGTEKVFTGHMYIPVKEGIPRQFVYTATGVADEEVFVYSTSADNTEIQIFKVDANLNIISQVTIVDDPYVINDTTNYYCTVDSMPSFEGFIVTFGNGVNIKSAATGDIFLIKYAETLGASGGVFQDGVVTKFSTVLLDVEGNTPAIYVTNDELIIDGQDYETITSIKQQASAMFQAGERAHAPNDWIAILKNYPTVHNAIVWTDHDLGNTAIAFSNSYVYTSVISSTGNNLTTSEQAAILLYLKPDKQALTDIVKFKPISVVNLRLTINAKIANVPASTVLSNIQTGLTSAYSILYASYKQSIYSSVITTKITEIDPTNIIYHNTVIHHCERSDFYSDITAAIGSRPVIVSNTASSETDPTKQVYILSGSVQLWITRKIANVWQSELQIAECGVYPTDLIGMNGYTISGGVVDYATNEITYNITDILLNPSTYGVLNPTNLDPLGYTLKIVYQTRDGNGNFTNDIRLPFFYNITDFKTDDLTFNYTYS